MKGETHALMGLLERETHLPRPDGILTAGVGLVDDTLAVVVALELWQDPII